MIFTKSFKDSMWLMTKNNLAFEELLQHEWEPQKQQEIKADLPGSSDIGFVRSKFKIPVLNPKTKPVYCIQGHTRLDRKFWQRSVNYKRGYSRFDKTPKKSFRTEK